MQRLPTRNAFGAQRHAGPSRGTLPEASRRRARGAPARVLCLALVLVPVAAAVTPSASAIGATYTVWTCATSSDAPLSSGSWARSADVPLADVQSTCGEPSAKVGALLATARATGNRVGGASWVLAAPKGTRITGLDVWWSWQVPAANARGAIRVYALGNMFLDPSGAADPFDGKGRCCSDSAFANLKAGAFGLPTVSNAATGFATINHQSFSRLRGLDGRGVPVVGLSAACTSGCNTSEVVAAFQAYRVRATIEDAAAPTGKAEGLRDGLRIGAGTPIDATATDAGGGVRELTLRVDGSVAQRVPGGTQCADVDPSNADPLEYNVAKPCASTLAGRLTLGAAQLPDSAPHTASVVATDAAGQDTVLATGRVALAAPRGFYDPQHGFFNPDLNIAETGGPNGSRAAARTKVTLGFVRARGTVRRRTIDYATAARIRGRVTTARGAPVARARVWVASRLAGGQWRLSSKPLRTSRSGVVTARLPGRRPSRGVRLVYFPATDRNQAIVSPRRGLRVRATTTIQSDQGGYRNGDTLTFTGQIIKRRLIPHKSVYLQAMVRGHWRTFATTEADARGHWRMTHRFEATRRATRYTFRAVVPSQTGYAWATGHSRRVRVLVTP